MAMIKCPRCELNYMQDAERMCTVCRREMHGEDEHIDIAGICPECGENPVAPGEELCLACIKELGRQEGAGEESFTAEAPIDLAEPSAMDEIEIAVDNDIPATEFPVINEEFSLDEDKSGDADAAEEDAQDDEHDPEALRA